MKNKKLLALLCAAAMTVTAFSGITVFADGEEPVAEEMETHVFDFETADKSMEATLGRGMTAETIDVSAIDETAAALRHNDFGSKIMKVEGVSTETSKYDSAVFDLSEYTKGKAHVVIEYDTYFSSAGRMQQAFDDTTPTGYDLGTNGGIWSLGNTGNSPRVIKTNTWLHVIMDIKFADGASEYSYTVTGADADGNYASVASNPSIKRSKQELLYFYLTSWYPATSYIDNFKISTSGTYDLQYEEPEPASTVEGSGIDLIPEEVLETFDDEWADAVESTAEILNHSTAKKAQTTENTSINTYTDKARGYSIFAAYDVYVTPGSSIALVAYGDGGKAVGPSLTISADKSGIVTAVGQGDADSKPKTTLTKDLRHGTWYRVVAEYPQVAITDEDGNATGTKLGNTSYTIYRIDPSDPSQTASVAARALSIAPRNLSGRGLTSLGLNVSGDVYIDNQVAYKAEHVDPVPEYGDFTTSYASGTITVTDATGAAETAVAIIASYDSNGIVTDVTKADLTFEDGKATVSKTLSKGDKVFVWATLKGMKPYADVYTQK